MTDHVTQRAELPPRSRISGVDVDVLPVRHSSPPAARGRGWWFLSITATNFWLDALLLALFLGQFWVSLVLRFAFPPGPAAGGWTLWGYGYTGWTSLRFGLTCAFGAAVVLHLMLHWNWICSVVGKWLRGGKPKGPVAKDDPTRTIWGVILLIGVLGALGILLGLAKMTMVSPYQ